MKIVFHKFTDIDRGIYGGVSFTAEIKSIQVRSNYTTIWTFGDDYFHVKELPHEIHAEIERVKRETGEC